MPLRETMTARGVLVAGLLLALAGCAGSRLVDEPDPFRITEAGDDEIRILVENLNFLEARLYAIHLGQRELLGTVGGKDTAAYTLPWTHSEPLQIEIDLLAGPKCRTAVIETDPGDVLELRIEGVLSRTRGCR